MYITLMHITLMHLAHVLFKEQKYTLKLIYQKQYLENNTLKQFLNKLIKKSQHLKNNVF